MCIAKKSRGIPEVFKAKGDTVLSSVSFFAHKFEMPIMPEEKEEALFALFFR